MTGPDRLECNDIASAHTDDSGRVVVPLPRGRRDAARSGDDRWEFRTEVRRIAGTEGAWLRQELAAVIRDLLVWAHDDLSRQTSQDHGKEQRAA